MWYRTAGQQIYYEDTGRGDAVVLLPGWGGSIIELDALRAELVFGFRVIAIDLPGSGRSLPQPRHYQPSYYRDDAQVLQDMLGALEVDAAHLVGFSDGGETALLMAALQPARVTSVVTWGAAGHVSASPTMLDQLDQLLEQPGDDLEVLAAYLVEAYGLDVARTMASTWARTLREIVDRGGDISRSSAADIRCPTLLLTGTHDPFCPPDLVNQMATAVSRGEFREVEGGGHDLHRSHTRWLVSTVVDWLSNH